MLAYIVSGWIPYHKVLYNVYLDSSLFRDYPNIYVSFIQSCAIWERDTPIHINIHKTLEKNDIIVDFTNLQGPPFYKEKNVIGFYVPQVKLLLISDSLENENWPTNMGRAAVAVGVHELGHAFGLSHIVGPGNKLSEPGDIMLGSDDEAMLYIMYPSIEGFASGVSRLEIKYLFFRKNPDFCILRKT